MKFVETPLVASDSVSVHPQSVAMNPAEVLFDVQRGREQVAVSMSQESAGQEAMSQGVPNEVLDEYGALPAGALSLLADHALGGGIMQVLDPDLRMVTSHLHLEFVRQPKPGATRFLGHSDMVELVAGSAFSRGRITTAHGELVSLVSGRFVVLDAQRVEAGEVTSLPISATNGSAPLTNEEATWPNEWTTSPVHQLLGTQRVHLQNGPNNVRLTMTARADLANERGGLHGGSGALMGERAGELALRDAAGDRHQFRPVELRIVFLRPVPANGAALVCEAEVSFLGRTTAATTARLLRSDGKLAVQVDAVYAL